MLRIADRQINNFWIFATEMVLKRYVYFSTHTVTLVYGVDCQCFSCIFCIIYVHFSKVQASK